MLEQLEKNWPEYKLKVVPEVFMLFGVYEGLQEMEEAIASRYDLHCSDFRTLLHLRCYNQEKVLSPTDLYSSLNLTSGGLTKILHRLTNKGLVKRMENPEDKRSSLVQLTQSGEDILTQVMEELSDEDHRLFAVLSNTERETLKSVCVKMLTHMAE